MNTFNFIQEKLGKLKTFALSELKNKKKKGAAAMDILIIIFIGAALAFVVLQVLKQALQIDLIPAALNYIKSFLN